MFALCREPLDPQKLAAEMENPRAGALVAFEGWVRNHHDARAVRGLEYEAFADMAVSVGGAILDEAVGRFSVTGAQAVHRVGPVGIGERAIWVGVTAEHRQEAFMACRWIMDRIKQDVPIWKKEAYETGPSEWVNAGEGGRDGGDDPAANPQYARQVNLPGIGAEGQRKLAASSILVIGAGGLGCPALQYLAAAGVGRLTVCDGDRVDVTNLHRQILFTAADVGRSKAEAAAERLRAMNPAVVIRTIATAADADTLPVLIDGHDVVLDCTDSFEAKYAIHDACWRDGARLVQAAVHQFEGYVQVIDPHADAGCFRCLWPEPPPAGCVGNCAEAGVLGVTPGLLGTYQAVEALKVLLGWPDTLHDATFIVDVRTGRTRRLKRSARTDCPCRGTVPWPEAANHLLHPGERARTVLNEAVVIDLREAVERVGNPEWIQDLPHMPRARWEEIPECFSRRPLVLCCAGGIRSRICVEQLECPPGVYAWTGTIEDLAAYTKTGC